MYVCVCVCVFLANDSSETVQVFIIKVCMVTASNMRMHHVLITFTLTFIQGHTDLNHENNECLIISETVQAMAIKFAVKIVQLKVYIIFSQSNDLALHSKSQLHLKHDNCLTCIIIAISRTAFKLWHSNLAVDLCMAYLLIFVSMTLTLMQVHSGSAKANIQC